MTRRTTPTTSTLCGATSPATSVRTCSTSTTGQATERNRTANCRLASPRSRRELENLCNRYGVWEDLSPLRLQTWPQLPDWSSSGTHQNIRGANGNGEAPA
jgi:hypothetical protein